MSIYTNTVKPVLKVITFLQIYTFSDSDFSTLIENRNNSQFSQTICAKSSGKLTLFKTVGNINPAYSPLKISCHSHHFFFFMGQR